MFMDKLEKFVNSHTSILYGFYMDVTGACCLNLGKYLISIFQNTDTNSLDLRVDTLSQNGVFENDVEWITPDSEEIMAAEICRVIRQYSK